MGEIALYVKGKMPTIYAVLGLGYGGGLVGVSSQPGCSCRTSDKVIRPCFFGEGV